MSVSTSTRRSLRLPLPLVDRRRHAACACVPGRRAGVRAARCCASAAGAGAIASGCCGWRRAGGSRAFAARPAPPSPRCPRRCRHGSGTTSSSRSASPRSTRRRRRRAAQVFLRVLQRRLFSASWLGRSPSARASLSAPARRRRWPGWRAPRAIARASRRAGRRDGGGWRVDGVAADRVVVAAAPARRRAWSQPLRRLGGERGGASPRAHRHLYAQSAGCVLPEPMLALACRRRHGRRSSSSIAAGSATPPGCSPSSSAARPTGSSAARRRPRPRSSPRPRPSSQAHLAARSGPSRTIVEKRADLRLRARALQRSVDGPFAPGLFAGRRLHRRPLSGDSRGRGPQRPAGGRACGR